MSIYDQFVPAQLGSSQPSQLGYQIEPGVFLGGTLQDSIITADGGPSISQQSQNLINNYRIPTPDNQFSIGSPSNQWNNLSKLKQNKMLRDAKIQQWLDSRKNNDGRGGSTGFDWSPIAGGIGSAMQLCSTLFGKQYDDPGYGDEQAAAKFASNFGFWGKLAAGLATTSSQVTRKLGLNTSFETERLKNASGGNFGTQLGNRALSLVNNTTFGILSPFSKKMNDFNLTSDAEAMSGAFSGTVSDMQAATDAAGKRFFLNKSGISGLVDNSIINQDLMTNIGLDNTRKISSVPYNASMIESRNFRKINGMTGQNYGVTAGKQGMKMLSREELDRIYASRKQISYTSDDIQKFQNGGSILIPDGALHAHKHHMEDVNPELAEDLTKKGIPVVSTDENGEVTQVAEIERQEIILEKSLTEKIEKLWKEGTEEAMIEAGKIITETLFTNCDDNANLVKEIE